MTPAIEQGFRDLLGLISVLEALHPEDVTLPVPFNRCRARKAVFAKAAFLRAEIHKITPRPLDGGGL